MNKNKPSNLVLLAVAILAQVAATGCKPATETPQQKSAEKSPTSTELKVAAVVEKGSSDNINLPVSFEGYEQTLLVPRIEGYVKEVKVDIGDKVKKGDTLVMLSAPELEAEKNRREKMLIQAKKGLESAEAKLKQAKSMRAEQKALLDLRESEFSRVSKLVERGSLSADRRDEAKFGVASARASMARVEADIVAAEADLESAKAAVEVAQAELTKAKSMSDFRSLTAPFDGVITMRNVDAGAYVVPSSESDDALLKIERITKLRGVMHIGTGGVGVGTKAKLGKISGMPGVTIDKDNEGKPLTISRTSNVFDSKTRLMRLEIALSPPVDPKTKQPLLKPGDYATASLQIGKAQSTFSVPKTAVGNDGNESFVVVLKDRTCHRVKVTTGDAPGSMVKVQTTDKVVSLEGRKVIAENPSRFKNGQQIDKDVKIVE